MSIHTQALRGSVPFRLRTRYGMAWLDWCEMKDDALSEPFFDPAIERRLREDASALRSTPVEVLLELDAEALPKPPGALIFHLSRCGSTLISQTLSSSARLSVFSEPTVVEELLRHTKKRPRDEQQALLRGLVKAFAAFRDNDGVILKLTARAVADAEHFAAALPEMARVFVYRDPVEVLVSLVGSRAERLPPGLESAGLLPEDPAFLRRLRPAEFWARVIARQCEAALALAEKWPTLLLNYQQLPHAVWEVLAPGVGIDLSPEEVESMREAATRRAKNPAQPFTSDGERKQNSANAEIRALAELWVRPLVNRLEKLRVARAPSLGPRESEGL